MSVSVSRSLTGGCSLTGQVTLRRIRPLSLSPISIWLCWKFCFLLCWHISSKLCSVPITKFHRIKIYRWFNPIFLPALQKQKKKLFQHRWKHWTRDITQNIVSRPSIPSAVSINTTLGRCGPGEHGFSPRICKLNLGQSAGGVSNWILMLTVPSENQLEFGEMRGGSRCPCRQWN